MLRQPRCGDWARAAKSRGDGLKVHFKNTHETAAALKGMTLGRAKRFLKNVMKRKEIVPFRVFTGGVGRDAQCKGTGCANGRWPKKSALFLMDLVRNAEVNARNKNLPTDRVRITHIACNRARCGRRRKYRAHGRINQIRSQPTHVELFVEEIQRKVPKSRARPEFTKNKRTTPALDKSLRRNARIARRLFRIGY